MTNNTIWEGLKAKFEALINWLVRYSKIVLPIILVVCVALTIVIAVHANKRKIEQEETAVAPEEMTGEGEALLDVPEVPLEKDAVLESMNCLTSTIKRWWKAIPLLWRNWSIIWTRRRS